MVPKAGFRVILAPFFQSPPAMTTSSLTVSQRAAAHVQPFLDWLPHDQPPMDSLQKADPVADRKALESWRRVLMDHGRELFLDAGMEGLAWPLAAQQGVGHLVGLLKSGAAWYPNDRLVLHHGALTLTLASVPQEHVLPQSLAASAGAVSAEEPQLERLVPETEVRVVTMADVDREFEAMSLQDAIDATLFLHRVLPEASLPRLAIAAGTWAALAIVGRLGRTAAFGLAQSQEAWQVDLAWADWEKGGGATGEVVPPALFND